LLVSFPIDDLLLWIQGGLGLLSGELQRHPKDYWQKVRPCDLDRGEGGLCSIVLSAFFLRNPFDLLAVLASWGFQFTLIHSYAYNRTMVYFERLEYKIGIRESKHTTSRKTTSLYKWASAIIGITGIITYLIFK
jgi:hypothetical protein